MMPPWCSDGQRSGAVIEKHLTGFEFHDPVANRVDRYSFVRDQIAGRVLALAILAVSTEASTTCVETVLRHERQWKRHGRDSCGENVRRPPGGRPSHGRAERTSGTLPGTHRQLDDGVTGEPPSSERVVAGQVQPQLRLSPRGARAPTAFRSSLARGEVLVSSPLVSRPGIQPSRLRPS